MRVVVWVPLLIAAVSSAGDLPPSDATWTAPAVEHGSALPEVSAQVSPVGSNADGGPPKPPPEVVLRLLLSLK